MSKERLLKWYSHDESPVGINKNIAFPSSATASPSLISSISLEKVNSNDRQKFEATIQWTASLTATGAAVTTPPTPFSILAFQQAIFQVWRDNVGAGGMLVGQFTDTGGFIFFGVATTPTINIPTPNFITTTITCTDFGVAKHKHMYYLTVTIPATNPSGALGAGALAVPGATASLVSPTVVGWHFAGSVIDENDT